MDELKNSKSEGQLERNHKEAISALEKPEELEELFVSALQLVNNEHLKSKTGYA